MMAKVEGMPLGALEAGVPWGWETFGEYLDALEGKVAVNAGFLVGHCALRRYVLGEDSMRGAPAEEQAAIVGLLRASIEAGGLGFSMLSRRPTMTATGWRCRAGGRRWTRSWPCAT